MILMLSFARCLTSLDFTFALAILPISVEYGYLNAVSYMRVHGGCTDIIFAMLYVLRS